MSGHSHAKTIRHAKNITDQKRGQVFSKMARVISVAVKEGGANPETNAKLRIAFEQAKAFNMPKENIERAIKKATGEDSEEKLEEILFEAYGPGGVAVIIEGITDNKNRTLGEIKQILNQYNGKLASVGSVKWLFERKGVVAINPADQTPELQKRDSLELIAIEAGAQDIYWHEDIGLLDIYTKPEELEIVRKKLEEKGIKNDSFSLEWVAKEEIPLNEEQKSSCEKFFEALEESESVQDVYSNLKV